MVDPFKVRNRKPTHAVIEIFGGDNNLSDFVNEDLAEMRKGLRGDFAVLALKDYSDKGAEVVELTKNGSKTLERWGEIDTGDPATLCQFLSRALVTYGEVPHLAIGFWDHGSGVFDEDDPHETILRGHRRPLRSARLRSVPARRLFRPFAHIEPGLRQRAMLNDDTNGGVLTNREAGAMLSKAFADAGRTAPVDLLFSDTCLNGMVEVLEELQQDVAVVVASEELEPGDGWDYYQWFRAMSDRPPATPQEWAKQAVRAFETGYRGRPDQQPCTLAAFTTGGKLTSAFKSLVEALRRGGRQGFLSILDARAGTQSFAHGYMMDTFDLQDFAVRLKSSIGVTEEIKAATDDVLAAINGQRVDSVALGADVRGANGIAFWCPGSRSAFERVVITYQELSFNKQTAWASYLAEQLRER